MISQADKIILDMTAAASTHTTAPPGMKLVVTWRDYPLHFHTNVSQGRCYSVCREEDASTFTTEQEARARASRHGLIWDQHCACVPVVPSVL